MNDEVTARGSGPSRRRPIALVAVALVVAAIAAAVAVAVTRATADEDHVARAIDIARPTDGYETGLEAGRTLARVASALNEDLRTCDRDAEPDRCAALGAVSGYTQVLAATVVRCTAPGRAEARSDVLVVLQELDERRPGDPPPRPPPLVRCGS
jgi:hypothetical protein